MQPNRYTELFFLDETTALAAGHRPCFECRRRDAEHFAALWGQMRGWPAPARAPEMDLALHAERVGAQGRKITYRAQLAALPEGAFVRLPDDSTARSYLIERVGFSPGAQRDTGRRSPPRNGAMSRCSHPAPSLPYFQPDIAPCCIPRPRPRSLSE